MIQDVLVEGLISIQKLPVFMLAVSWIQCMRQQQQFTCTGVNHELKQAVRPHFYEHNV